MKQFWMAALALLLALTVCGCDQQEDPPAPAGDTGSILQHEAEALQPVELTIEESEQCYRVIFADPRDMIYVSDTQATANGAVFHGVLTTETGLLVRSQEVSAPGQLLSSGGDEVDGALGLDAACRVQDNYVVCHIGGGISISAHQRGRMIDGNDIVGGEGSMAPTRCGALPGSGQDPRGYKGTTGRSSAMDQTTIHPYARSVSIIGVGCTPFMYTVDKPETNGLTEGELFGYAALKAMEDAGVNPRDVDFYFHGEASPLNGSNYLTPNVQIANWFGMKGKGSIHHSEACCTGYLAIEQAVNAVASGKYNCVLTGCVEFGDSTPSPADSVESPKHPYKRDKMTMDKFLKTTAWLYDRCYPAAGVNRGRGREHPHIQCTGNSRTFARVRYTGFRASEQNRISLSSLDGRRRNSRAKSNPI